MTATPDEILQKYVFDNLDICSRCFSPTMSKKEIGSGIAGGSACGDECGQLGISMESEPQPEPFLQARADRLIDILESNGIEVDSELLHLAVEDNASEHPPQEVFSTALEYALGQRDGEDLLPDPETDSVPGDTNQNQRDNRKTYDSLFERLVDGPISEVELEEFDTNPESINQLARLPVPMNTSDVYYLEQPREFAKQLGIEEIESHNPHSVVHIVISANWNVLQDASQSTIRKWMDEIPEEYSRHVLEVAVDVNPYNPIEDWQPSFRSTGFWPLVKRRKAQPILGCLQAAGSSPLSSEEIAEQVGESQQFVRQLLDILNENEYVERSNGGWVYGEG